MIAAGAADDFGGFGGIVVAGDTLLACSAYLSLN